MRCNACWQELEGRAVATTCGHLLCPEDAKNILSNDGSCPICDQVLSKSLMKPVEINPNDEWVNMAMTGISPQIMMKSAYRSVSFYIGQKELEMQFKMNKLVAQCKQKCEAMQEKFSEKLEQVYTAYQKMSKRCQMIEQEMESLSKDKQELEEKIAEKCRQKGKLDEMYNLAIAELESLKRSAIQPANHLFSTQEPDLFASAMIDNRDSIKKGPREDIWSARQSTIPIDPGNRMPTVHSSFGGSGSGAGNPSMTLKNLIFSPIKRPHISRDRTQLFTL